MRMLVPLFFRVSIFTLGKKKLKSCLGRACYEGDLCDVSILSFFPQTHIPHIVK